MILKKDYGIVMIGIETKNYDVWAKLTIHSAVRLNDNCNVFYIKKSFEHIPL